MKYYNKHREIRQLFLLLTVFLISGCSSKIEESEQNPTIEKSSVKMEDLKYMLNQWGSSFIQKIDSGYIASVNFKLTNSPLQYNISFHNKSYKIIPKVIDSVNFTYESSLKHYNKVFNGVMTALTSMGQASPADPIPLIPELHKAVTDNLLNDFLFFSQRFFNRTPYDRVQLGLENSRIVHGGHAIPIFYQKTKDIGVRSAWYQINKGEQVNEQGNTNPFPQYFIITKGSGYTKIGNDTISINENEAYFVPPYHDHVFWNESEEPLIMIFLAWGKGA